MKIQSLIRIVSYIITITLSYVSSSPVGVIYSQLHLYNYSPLQFKLSFSQSISLPSFQILVNNVNLNYKLLTSNNNSTDFFVEVSSNVATIDAQFTQMYSLIFNQPMNINNGTLYLANYILIPTKSNVQLFVSSWAGILIFTLLIILSFFGSIGLSIIGFLQVYLLVELKFKQSISLFSQLSSYLFYSIATSPTQSQYLVNLAIPLLIVLGCYLLGQLIKIISEFVKNPFLKQRMVVLGYYRLFLTIWTISIPSVLFKGCQFISDYKLARIVLDSNYFIGGIIITYLNILLVLTYLYVIYFVLNISSNQQSQTTPSLNYIQLYRGLQQKSFKRRNLLFFLTVKKIIVVVLYFFSYYISPYVLALQLLQCFFVFIIRPYKDLFYMNFCIASNLCWFFFYIVVLEGYFYFNMTQQLQTSYSLIQFLLAKSIILLLMCFLGILVAIFQGYRIISNLKYQRKQQNISKLSNSEKNRPRLLTQNSQRQTLQMKKSLIFKNKAQSSARYKQRHQSSANKQRHQSSANKGKINLFQIEMQQISSPKKKKFQTKKFNKKWKDRSLLQQLATQK